MDTISLDKFSLPTIRRINYCGMYLRVERLSDIVTNYGLSIKPHYFNGTKRNLFSNKTWPHQNNPPQSSWKEYRVTFFTILDANHCLIVPLKKWIHIDCIPRLWYSSSQ